MTDEEIKAKKFAMASQKEQEARKAKEDAEKDAQHQGRKFDEKDFEKNNKTFAGRPDNAKIAGMEPTDTTKNKSERIAVKESCRRQSDGCTEETAGRHIMDEKWICACNEFHTLQKSTITIVSTRLMPLLPDFYANTYKAAEKFGGDSIYDKTRHYRIQNTFAISLLEGFNKWAKAGLKAFITSDLRHFTLPDLWVALVPTTSIMSA